ncbi:MAG TPA: hypothetical protein VGM87_10750 [Roseomonas sp.]
MTFPKSAWQRAWAVFGILVLGWTAAMLLTPETCQIIGRCEWYSGFGIGLLGAPVILVALLVALALSAIVWWRRG